MLKNILSVLILRHKIVNLIILLLLIGGYASYSYMVKSTFPNIKSTIITVNVEYKNSKPDPQTVQESICIKLENALIGIVGVKNVETTANYGSGEAIIECFEGYNLNNIRNSVVTRVNAIDDFPRDTKPPVIQIEQNSVHILGIEVYGKTSVNQLDGVTISLMEEIRRLPGIMSVTSGLVLPKINFVISAKKLQEYGVTLSQVRQAISDHGYDIPAGKINTTPELIRLEATGRKYSPQEFRDIPIISKPDGSIVKLFQIANVSNNMRGLSESYFKYTENSLNDRSMDINKAPNANAFTLYRQIKKIIAEKQRTLPSDVHIIISYNDIQFIKESLYFVLENGILGMIFILVFLFFFLSTRVGVWVSLLIPVCLCGALIVLAFAGCTINIFSIFAMFMVIGLVVDDGIVVADSICHEKTLDDSKTNSTIRGTLHIFPATAVGSIIMIIAFIPLLFIPGKTGQLFMAIPIAAMGALAFSLFQSIFILPVQLRNYNPVKSGSFNKFHILKKSQLFVSLILDKFIEKVYTPVLKISLHYRYPAIAVSFCFLLFIFALLASNKISIGMPQIDDGQIGDVTLNLQAGSPTETSKKLAHKVIKAWKEVEKNYEGKYGKSLTKFFRVWGNRYHTQYHIFLTPPTERKESNRQLYFELVKQFGTPPPEMITGGSGYNQISLNIYGDDYKNIQIATNKIVEKLKTFNGVYNAGTNYQYGVKELVMKLKPGAFRYNLNLHDISEQVKNAFGGGGDILKLQRGVHEVPIYLSFPDNGRDSIEYFNNMRIKNRDGDEIPLSNLVTYQFKEGPDTIHSYNGKIDISVSASVDSSVSSPDLIYTSLNKKFLTELESYYGITISREGEEKETQEMVSSLMLTLPLVLLAIYFLLILITDSYFTPIIVLLLIPFSTAGGILGLYLLDINIFPIGLIAVMGVVVNNAIVILYEIRKNLRNGMPLVDSLVKGGRRRFRPIFLTAMTTSLALIPIIFENDVIGQFAKGISVQILFGLIIATLFTLLLLPCFYLVLNDIRRLCYAIWYWKMPSREEVEHDFKHRKN